MPTQPAVACLAGDVAGREAAARCLQGVCARASAFARVCVCVCVCVCVGMVGSRVRDACFSESHQPSLPAR